MDTFNSLVYRIEGVHNEVKCHFVSFFLSGDVLYVCTVLMGL